jgi:hypothetical protein
MGGHARAAFWSAQAAGPVPELVGKTDEVRA